MANHTHTVATHNHITCQLAKHSKSANYKVWPIIDNAKDLHINQITFVKQTHIINMAHHTYTYQKMPTTKTGQTTIIYNK